MKLLVTGGMGFIGSNFIRYVYNTYPTYTIINFDALTYAGNAENLGDIEGLETGNAQRYRFVQGDIADTDEARRVVENEQPDVIVNFAAESHVDRSIVDSSRFMRSNILGVHVLLELSKKHDITLVHISTDEVYGDVSQGFSSEESPMRPSSPYAASKASADLLVQAYSRTYKTRAIIMRGSNNFGPYQYPEKLIPLAITNISEGGKVPVHGSGLHVRAWLHVNDFCSAIDSALHQASPGAIYNVAGHADTNLNVIRTISEYLGVPLDDAIEHVPDRPGADMRYAPSARKIKSELGWRPKRRIAEALPDLVLWYRENSLWWRKVKEKHSFLDHYEKQRLGKYS